ncbi:MAG: thiol protease/hemagglutinin PrtT [Flavobacteriales bacterium]
MKKRVITSVALLFLLLNVSAKSISEATAKIVGQNFISTRLIPAGSKIKSTLALVYKGTDASSLVVFYVFNSSNGFVIVSADDNAIPILAYSDEGTFNPNNLGPNTKEILQNYSGQISHVAKNNIKPQAKITSDWNGYITGTSVTYKTEATSVAALVRSKWGQGAYYNASCPGGSVTGCVATAMAQIMKYWTNPGIGTGSHSYTHPTYGVLSANFGTASYDWCNMPNKVTSANSSVATLMYHCGVSVNMDYSPTGSGAYVIGGAGFNAQTAFKNYFGYKTSIKGLMRGNYTDDQWITMLKSNLDGGKPVLYAGFNTNGGHAFVCDGYDANNFFHFNYGWDGNSDGYYAINGIVSGFNTNQQALMDIEPVNRTVILGQYAAARITDHVVTGDFDRDGKEDDVAAFYEYGGYNTNIHVWKSSGSTFTYQGDKGWWNSTGYDASKIVAVLVGDFNRDGFKDDIAAFYDYGNYKTTIHVWTSTGSSFNAPTTAGWYTNTTYSAPQIKGRVVCGDFDRDGFKDDIAAFYDYGPYSTNIHVWQSTGSSFVGPTTNGWYSTTTYAPTNITNRVVSGDFDRDGYEDDIAAFYNYGAYSTNIHVWQSTGSSFVGPTTNGWYSTTTYAPSQITNRVVSGDFDRDGYKDDITAFYDYGSNKTTAHVWQSTGSSFVGPATEGWWNSPTYDAKRITGRVVSGDFNSDDVKDNIVAFYEYGGLSLAAHVWKSNGNSFSYVGDNGWWKVCDYGTMKKGEETEDVVSEVINTEHFQVYPNPATSIVNLRTDLENSKVEVYNALGELVYSLQSTSGEITNIDLSAHSKGLYFLKVSNGEINSCVKVILQ